jgi:hypothetical protein
MSHSNPQNDAHFYLPDDAELQPAMLNALDELKKLIVSSQGYAELLSLEDNDHTDNRDRHTMLRNLRANLSNSQQLITEMKRYLSQKS